MKRSIKSDDLSTPTYIHQNTHDHQKKGVSLGGWACNGDIHHTVGGGNSGGTSKIYIVTICVCIYKTLSFILLYTEVENMKWSVFLH